MNLRAARRQLRILGRLFRHSATSKRELRHLVQEHGEWLLPGLWSLSPDRPTQRPVALHVRSRPRSAATPVKMFTPPRAPTGQGGRVLFELRRLAEACAPPWILRVAPPKARVLPVGGSNGYTMVTPARTGGALLLRPNQLVLRRQPENAREQAEARKLLRNFLRTPSFRLVGDGAFVEEEFLDGRLLLDLPADSWEPTLEQLLSCYVEAGPRYDRGSSEEAIRQALERLDRLPRAAVPQGWMDTVSRQRDGLLKRSRSWPLTPSHGDLLPGNVILTADGPAAIDLEYAGWLPFYFDAFRLLIESAARSAEPDVAALHTWWRRDRLHALFTLRGLRLEDERALALLGYVALTAYLYGGGEEGGDDAVARMLTFQWRRLAHLLEDTGTRP